MQQRFDELEAVGLARDFTEEELLELGRLFEESRAVKPTTDPANVHNLLHPAVNFWQRLAMHPKQTTPNIKAMHKHIAPVLLSVVAEWDKRKA